jgi:hypothetical protein
MSERSLVLEKKKSSRFSGIRRARKPREVDAAAVHFNLREVRMQSEIERERGADA